MEIYYDGTNIARYGSLPSVVGFTTNTSFMKASGITNYPEFFDKVKGDVDGRPISFQVFEDDPRAQARTVSKYGPNVWAKVPVVDVKGRSNVPAIRELLLEGIKVNITAVFTLEQCTEILESVLYVQTPVIVSIFAGRISDTGRDPLPIIQDAVKMFNPGDHIKVLWAGCKEVLEIIKARDVGCQIITVPGDLLDKMDRIGMDLTKFSIATTVGFKNDATSITL